MRCYRCGREAELRAGGDGGLYCNECIQQVDRPVCATCNDCSRRYCGIKACPFCKHGTPDDTVIFERELAAPVRPLAIQESCERCGAPMDRVFVLHGKALCRDCLYFEQDKWEIVTAKPGKGGTRVSIVIDKTQSGEWSIKPRKVAPAPGQGDIITINKDPKGRKLLQMVGIDPDNPPKGPFQKGGPLAEKKMSNDACINCEAYRMGKMGKRYLGRPKDSKQK